MEHPVQMYYYPQFKLRERPEKAAADEQRAVRRQRVAQLVHRQGGQHHRHARQGLVLRLRRQILLRPLSGMTA